MKGKLHFYVTVQGSGSNLNIASTSDVVAILPTTTTTTTTTINHESCTADNKPEISLQVPNSPVTGAAGTTVTVKGDWMHGPDVHATCSWVFKG
jgi:hypothetical protein